MCKCQDCGSWIDNFYSVCWNCGYAYEFQFSMF